MHTRGRPTEWRTQPPIAAADVVPLVLDGLDERLAAARAAGILQNRIVLDPVSVSASAAPKTSRCWPASNASANSAVPCSRASRSRDSSARRSLRSTPCRASTQRWPQTSRPSLPELILSASTIFRKLVKRSRLPTPSQRQHFLLFRFEQLLNALDLTVGQRLNLFIRALLIVGGDQLVLGRFLDALITLTTDVA